MAGFGNAKADNGLLEKQLTKNLNLGEKLMGFQFDVKIEGYENSGALARSTQYPAMGYSDVEDFGEGGMKIVSDGALENSGEITATFIETIKGDTLKMLKDIILNKKMVNIDFAAQPESLGGKAAPYTSCKLKHCKIKSDAIDFATEDTAALTKVSVTITYNWVDHKATKASE